MNYVQYLQAGATIEQAPSQDELSQMVEAFKQNPEEVLSQLGDKAPEFLKEMMQVAEQTQDMELGELVQNVAKQIGLMKCGGKVRAKIKKACGGRKMEKGSKIPMKKAGAPCPCTYKKVGGKLVTVDCNGNVIK